MVRHLVSWFVCLVVSLAALCVLVLVYFNWNDAPLQPEVANAIEPHVPSQQELEGNRFFMMNALAAPASVDAMKLGVQHFQEQQKAYASWLNGQLGSGEFPESEHFDSILPYGLRCSNEQSNCYDFYIGNKEVLGIWLDTEQNVIDRYLSIAEEGVYEEVLIPCICAPLPNYVNLVEASELVNIQATLLFERGERAQAYALWRRNMQVYRKVSDGARTLIGGMIATVMARKQLRVLSEVMATVSATDTDIDMTPLAEIILMAKPQLKSAYQGEMAWSMAQHKNMPRYFLEASQDNGHLVEVCQEGNKGWEYQFTLLLTEHLYLPHETANAMFIRWQAIAGLTDVAAPELETQVEIIEAKEQALGGWHIGSVYMRNPVGQAVMRMGGGAQQHLSYFFKMHDVEGYRRLVYLQLLAHQQKPRRADMAQWLKRQSRDLANPYTQEPMYFDSSDGALVFMGKANASTKELKPMEYRVRLFD